MGSMKKKVFTSHDVLQDLKERACASTQKQVAEDISVSQPYLSDVINGRRDINSALAARLGYKQLVIYERMYAKRS